MLQQLSSNFSNNQTQPAIEIETDLGRLQADENSVSIQMPATEINQRSSTLNTGTMELEQAYFFRKTGAIVISMIIWLVLAANESNVDKKLENLSLLSFCCITYIMFENTVFCLRQVSMSSHIAKERAFDALDGVLAVYFLIAVGFWDGENATKPLLYFSMGIYLLITGLYLRLALASSLISKSALIRRICYTIQVWLIILKLVGFMAFGWRIIFLPVGLYLVGHQVYGSFILIESSVQLSKRIDNRETNNLSFIQRSTKMSWDVVHYGLLLVTFGIVFNLFNMIEDPHHEGLMKVFFTVSQWYSSLFLGYALIFRQLLKEFNSNMLAENNIKQEDPKKKHSFVPQKDLVVCDFIKVSPTYFVKSEGEVEKDTVVRTEEAEEEVCCYICEENKPDTILMGCGHGGMCKDCALLSMKKNNNCMQCRKPIQSIYQITEEDKNTRMVKACEAFHLVY